MVFYENSEDHFESQRRALKLRSLWKTDKGAVEGGGLNDVNDVAKGADSLVNCRRSTYYCRTVFVIHLQRCFFHRLVITVKMETNTCNIQVLLQAAEFLERRERGTVCQLLVIQAQSENEIHYKQRMCRNEMQMYRWNMHVKVVITAICLRSDALSQRKLFSCRSYLTQ